MSVTSVEFRVRYAETDQMGLAYHAHYLVWCDVARTDHLRRHGVNYRELEEQGLFLAVVDASVRFAHPAKYDDLLRVSCWVRNYDKRRVEFGYLVERADSGKPLAKARTTLIALDGNQKVTRLPDSVKQYLQPVADPVRL